MDRYLHETPGIASLTTPQWSLFPSPNPKMTAPSLSNRRAVIYQSTPSSPREVISINPRDIGVAHSQSIGVARTQSNAVTRKQSRDLRPDTAPLDGGKPKSHITHPQFQNFVSIWEDPALQAYVRPAPEVTIPPRVSSKIPEDMRMAPEPTPAMNPRARSSSTQRSLAGSEASSYSTKATSIPALQSKVNLDESEAMRPLNDDDLDPGSFDLVAPAQNGPNQYSLETRSEQLFSADHLRIIFDDPSLLLRFTGFLSAHKPSSVPVLVYYLDAVKALKAISYSNAIVDSLGPIPGCDFTANVAYATINKSLEEKAQQAFDVMVQNDLPAYITHVYIQTVSLSITRRIIGTLPPHLREASEGLAEVFCLTDPSRPDNPIVFASEEFHRTTQYGMSYVIGRNCRFLQGPKTNPFSVTRLREKIAAGQEHCEVFLNYRRDGSPFMNLLMIAPLCDSRGTIRYFIGAQVDVSGLVKECYDLESLKRLTVIAEHEDGIAEALQQIKDNTPSNKDEFQELSEMFNLQELETVRRCGGRMHREQEEEVQETNGNGKGSNWNKTRLLIHEGSPDGLKSFHSIRRPTSGKLSGVYENYLLVRPYPSLRILFASPSLRVPGILQSPFMSKVGGSSRVREELTRAMADGRGVTAKIRWVSKHDMEGRNRWIHCTPLIGSNGAIGVWMVVIVDDEREDTPTKYRQAPPVDPRFGRPARLRDDDQQSIMAESLRDFAAANGGRVSTSLSFADNRPPTANSMANTLNHAESQYDLGG